MDSFRADFDGTGILACAEFVEPRIGAQPEMAVTPDFLRRLPENYLGKQLPVFPGPAKKPFRSQGDERERGIYRTEAEG